MEGPKRQAQPVPAQVADAVRSEVDAAAAFTEHYPFVWRVLVAAGVARADADDAVQEVFITVHRRRRDYDGRAPLRHWIYGIARGVGRNHARKTLRAARRQKSLEPADQRRAQTAQPQVHADQESAVARREASDLLARFVDSLGADQREVFVLVHIEGMAVPEIADMLGAPVNTLYSRLRLARERFETMVSRIHTKAQREG